jgi:TolA-binding protein
MVKRFISSSSLFFIVLVVVFPTRGHALPESERLWLVGEQAFQDRLFPLAHKSLERFVLRYPQDARFPDAVLLLGKARLAVGQTELALESFRLAQRFPTPPGKPGEMRFWEGEALFRLKRYSEAKAAYEQVSGSDSPFAPDAFYGLAWTALEQKQNDSAMSAFRTIIDRWPAHAAAAGATYHLARLHAETKRHEDVIALLRNYSTTFPESQFLPEATYLLGWSELASGRTEAGAATLKGFVARFPNHELSQRARSDLVDVLLREGRKAEVEKEIRALLTAKPPTPEGLADAALFAKKLGRQKEAESAWRTLKQEFPRHPLAQQASLELARQAFDRRQFKEAASAADLAAQSDDPAVRLEGLLLLGESELKQKRQKAALKAFQSAVDLGLTDSPLHYRALAGVGLAHEDQREWAQALKAYEVVARESPDRTLKQWAGGRLAEMKNRLKPPQPKAKPQKPKGASS